jgi:hypothetical protein
VTVLGEDNALWEVFLSADTANDVLHIRVAGENMVDTRFVATVRTAEVGW